MIIRKKLIRQNNIRRRHFEASVPILAKIYCILGLREISRSALQASSLASQVCKEPCSPTVRLIQRRHILNQLVNSMHFTNFTSNPDVAFPNPLTCLLVSVTNPIPAHRIAVQLILRRNQHQCTWIHNILQIIDEQHRITLWTTRLIGNQPKFNLVQAFELFAESD